MANPVQTQSRRQPADARRPSGTRTRASDVGKNLRGTIGQNGCAQAVEPTLGLNLHKPCLDRSTRLRQGELCCHGCQLPRGERPLGRDSAELVRFHSALRRAIHGAQMREAEDLVSLASRPFRAAPDCEAELLSTPILHSSRRLSPNAWRQRPAGR